jgi:hypothetical protein
MSDAKQSNKLPTQEEQFIIRFPPQLAKRIRKMLKAGQISNLDLAIGGLFLVVFSNWQRGMPEKAVFSLGRMVREKNIEYIWRIFPA